MALNRNSPLILRLLILCVECLGVEATETPFYIEPYDVKQVFPYGSSSSVTLTLSCGVEHLTAGTSVAWYKNGRQISSNTRVYSDVVDSSRYKLDVFAEPKWERMGANLQVITSAANAYTDSGNYHCRVTTKPPLISREARLDVFVTPRSGNLRCSIGDDPDDDVLDVSEGIEIRLSCRSDRTGVPAMTTYWTGEGPQGDTLDTPTTASNDADIRDGSLVLLFSWTPTNRQNGATFICTGFHPEYKTNRTCQLGPFNVQYRPIVKLSVSLLTVTMETQAVTFTCIADANPPATRYLWGNTTEEKFDLNGDNVTVGPDRIWIQMKNFGSQDNGVYNVTCHAENEVGLSLVNGTSTLTVNIQALTTVKTVSEYLSTAASTLTSPSTAASTITSTSGKGNEHIPSDGQYDVASVTQVGTSTSFNHRINRTAENSHTMTIVIIGSAVGWCSFVFAVIGVALITSRVCVRNSRKKSLTKASADTRVSAHTYSVLHLYEEMTDVKSPDVVNQSRYSTVDHEYNIINDYGNTSNVDSTSVEMTAQAGVLYKNTDGNRGDKLQSLVKPSVIRIGKQGKSISPITSEDTENKQTETRNGICVNEDMQQKSETGRNRQAEGTEAEDTENTKTETGNPPNPYQYSTVDQLYATVNDDGNTPNFNSTSVEMTSQSGVLFMDTEGSRVDTMQSLYIDIIA